MKLGAVTKFGKRNKTTSKKFAMTSCPKIVTPLSSFRFVLDLEQSGSRILDEESAKRMFSLIVIFYLTKTENIIKKSLTQLPHYCFE